MLLLEKSAKIDVQVEAAYEDLAFSYSGEIHTGENILQKGAARASRSGILFEQDCESLFTEAQSYHKYNSTWIPVQRNSPISQLADWLTDINAGRGSYKETPIAAETLFPETMPMPEYVPQDLYLIRIPLADFDFSAWCNVYLNSMFATGPLPFSDGDIGLYFDAKTQGLSVVTVRSEATSGLLNAVLTITSCGDDHSQDLDPKKISKDTVSADVLSEQWKIANNTFNDLPDISVPNEKVLESMRSEYLETKTLTVRLGEKDLPLPCSMAEITDAEFSYEGSLTEIPAQTNTALTLHSPDGCITVIAHNGASNAVSLEEAQVSGLYLMREDIGSVVAALPGGVTLASATEDITSIWTEISGDAGLYQLGKSCTAEVYELNGKIYCIGISLQ